MKREYIDVLTAGGTITVDLTNTHEEGLLDGDGDGSKGDAIAAVQNNIAAQTAVLNSDGDFMVIERGVAIAFTFREEA
jgi:hypothetical protein